MARRKRLETPEEIKAEQKEVTRKYTAWHRKNKNEECRRIDEIDGIKIDGVKYFYVSTSGKVISCLFKEARELNYNHADKLNVGYAQVNLYGKQRLVHRLVMETFKDYIFFAPLNKNINEYEVHHISKEKSENGFLCNAVDNLMGLSKDIHTKLFNEQSIVGLMTNEKKSFEYMKKVVNVLGEIFPNQSFMILSGSAIDKKTGEETTDKEQTIQLLSGDNLKIAQNLANEYIAKNSCLVYEDFLLVSYGNIEFLKRNKEFIYNSIIKGGLIEGSLTFTMPEEKTIIVNYKKKE